MPLNGPINPHAPLIPGFLFPTNLDALESSLKSGEFGVTIKVKNLSECIIRKEVFLEARLHLIYQVKQSLTDTP